MDEVQVDIDGKRYIPILILIIIIIELVRDNSNSFFDVISH